MTWQYGWNAQSALLPEQKKYIKVTDKGMDKINSQLLLYKSKSISNQQKTINSFKQKRQNKKIIKNIQKKQDQINSSNTESKSNDNWLFVQQKLLKKKKIYDQLQKNSRNHSNILVDFQEKDLQKTNQDEQFLILKNDFYSTRLKQLQNEQQKLTSQGQINVIDHVRQNLHWEKQILEELKGDIFIQKEKVAQSFDRKLTLEEKEALEKIVKQKICQKQKQKQIIEKRQQEKLSRLRKLRKLDILQ